MINAKIVNVKRKRMPQNFVGDCLTIHTQQLKRANAEEIVKTIIVRVAKVQINLVLRSLKFFSKIFLKKLKLVDIYSNKFKDFTQHIRLKIVYIEICKI